jgi:hypothetical protein
MLPCVGEMTGARHYAQILDEMESCELFAQADLESWSSGS